MLFGDLLTCRVRLNFIQKHRTPHSTPNLIKVYPTRQIRIDFRGEPIELEELYEALRTYGTVNRLVHLAMGMACEKQH